MRPSRARVLGRALTPLGPGVPSDTNSTATPAPGASGYTESAVRVSIGQRQSNDHRDSGRLRHCVLHVSTKVSVV